MSNTHCQEVESDLSKKLVGRKIILTRYLTNEEIIDLGWDQKAIVIFLDDGTYLFPSRDDEGNGPGALFTSIPGYETIGVF